MLGVLKSDYPDVELSDQNIWQFLYPKLKKWGDLPAYVMAETEESLTYKELLDKSLCWALELKKYFQGSVPPTVSYVMKNNIDCFPLFLGCWAVGADICPVRDEVNDELFEIMMAQLKPDIIVLDSSSLKIFGPVIDRLKNKPTIYVRGHSSRSGTKDFQQTLNSGIKLQESEAGKFESTAVACKVFSSGTTGAPKCIVCSHRSFTNVIISVSQKEVNSLLAADEASQSTIIGYLPLAHIFEFGYFTIFAPSFGCRSIYMEYDNNTQKVISAAAKYKPELLRLRYFAIEELSKIENFESIKSVKTIVFTGCPPNVESFKRINENFGNKLFLQNVYGSTEANLISSMPVNDGHHLGRAGKLLSNCQARFVDSITGENITEPYKIGDIYIKSPFIMDCYLNNPAATAEAIDSDGWFCTGDVGYFDEENFLEIIERKNDIITVCVGKEKKVVLPTKIEAIIKLHEGVADVGVIGMPDVKTGEEVPKAFVVCKYPVDEKDLIEFVEQRVPEEMRLVGGITFVKELSRNPMGKLNRKSLREKVWLQR